MSVGRQHWPHNQSVAQSLMWHDRRPQVFTAGRIDHSDNVDDDILLLEQ